MNSVSAGSRSRVASAKSVPSTLETKRKVRSRSAVVPQRLVGHHRAEVGAADADVDDVADALARCGPSSAPLRTRVGEARHPVEHRVHLRARRPRRRRRSLASRGARRATCSTARFSVTLIWSPRNIASIRSRRPDSSASSTSRRERLVGDAVLGEVREQPDRLEAQCARPGRGHPRRACGGARPSSPRGAPRAAATRVGCAGGWSSWWSPGLVSGAAALREWRGRGRPRRS